MDNEIIKIKGNIAKFIDILCWCKNNITENWYASINGYGGTSKWWNCYDWNNITDNDNFHHACEYFKSLFKYCVDEQFLITFTSQNENDKLLFLVMWK